MLDAAKWTTRLGELARQARVPGAVLGIWAGGQEILAARGVLNRATRVRVSTDSVFQVGSITKPWTATMIMQLIDAGLLSLDTTVAQALPGLRLGAADLAEQVTVAHLLTHTSGIDGDIFTDTGRGDDCVERYVGLLERARSAFPPGGAYSYCNSGWVVLGRIIEVLDGRSWDESLRERLCGPLELTQTVTLPKNVENAYLDVIAQSQNEEEQWFFCVPTAIASGLGLCGNTAFRQVDVSIDGKPAGVAPVFPWIYTGGVDPGLWIPIPGVQTLNLLPYRVDLTPFAGTLSDGQPHTVGVTVFNAFEFFSTIANLLVYQDHGRDQVTGAVTEDTLADPNPTVVNNVTVDASGNAAGTVTVTSAQNFTIAGFVNTSHGRVNTKIDGAVNFGNVQSVTSTPSTFGQGVVQTSTVNQKTTTQTGLLFTTKESNVSYPFTINYLETVESNGNIGQVSTVDQNFQRNEVQTIEGLPIFQSNVRNEVSSADTATFVASPTGFSLGPNTGQSSKQTYTYKDTLGNCYSRQLAASSNVLNTVTDGRGCPHR